MTYDYKAKKIVAVVAANVEPAVALNIVGHLGVAVGKNADAEIMGREKLADKSGVEHVGISRYPVIVTKVKSGKLRQAIVAGRQNPRILVVDYPREMLTTAHDDELAEAILAKNEADLEYLGAMFYGESGDVDAITGKFQLWRMD